MLGRCPRLCGRTSASHPQRQAYRSTHSRRHSALVVKAASTTASRPDGLQARLAEAPRQQRPDHNDVPRLLNLVQWAIANKIAFSGIRPDVRDGVRGVFATSPLQPGDTVVAVPTSSALTITPNERCPFTTFVPEDVWVGLPWYAQLALKLCHERSLGAASRFADYLAALPRHVDLPATWPRDHVRRLQYPYLEQQISDEQEEWSRLYDRLKPYLSRRNLTAHDLYWALSCVRSRTFAGPYLPTPPAVKMAAGAALGVAAAALLLQLGVGELGPALGAAALAGVGLPVGWQAAEAKAAQSGAAGTVLYAVCPLTDMFNHSSAVQTDCVFAPWRSEFRVVAAQAVPRGQQVLINYGSQSNDALLQRYGFVEDGNPQDRYVLSDIVSLLARAAQQGDDALGGVSAERVREAAGRLAAPPNALQEVAVTASGAPEATLSALQDLHRALGCKPAAALLAAAARTELAAAATKMQEDEAALGQLVAWQEYLVRRAAEDEKAAAFEREKAEREERERRERREREAAVLAAESAAEGGLGGVGKDVRVGAEGEGEGAEGQEEEEVFVRETPVPPPAELEEMGGDVERFRTVVAFRVAKKRVLTSLVR